MTDRPTVDVAAPAGGWTHPWPNVAEITTVLPHTNWTLIGGLMAQLHAAHHGIAAARPTADVDMVLHVETTAAVAQAADAALTRLGYRLKAAFDPRDNTAHRYTRGDDIVDLLLADHAAPRVTQRLRGHDMVRVDGATQALRRTINARLMIRHEEATVVSVPSPFAAVILKAAAYEADSRDRDRHLQDAVVLLAAITDPIGHVGELAGSDRSRLQTLRRRLPDECETWHLLGDLDRRNAQGALRILANA